MTRSERDGRAANRERNRMLRKVFAGGWSAAAAVAGMLSPGNGFGAMNAGENVGIDDLIAATKVVA